MRKSHLQVGAVLLDLKKGGKFTSKIFGLTLTSHILLSVMQDKPHLPTCPCLAFHFYRGHCMYNKFNPTETPWEMLRLIDFLRQED